MINGVKQYWRLMSLKILISYRPNYLPDIKQVDNSIQIYSKTPAILCLVEEARQAKTLPIVLMVPALGAMISCLVVCNAFQSVIHVLAAHRQLRPVPESHCLLQNLLLKML